MMTFPTDFSRCGLALVVKSAVAAALLFAVPAGAAHGAGHGDHSTGAQTAATRTAQSHEASLNTLEVGDGKNCGQSRKRLFVEGEGWIVRKVTTCY